ncbi:outer membrane protein assembly factor BamA [Mucilaginibacter yixingensis]|uniref:Outer membrane protein assembly factor BamA n=1 Tax=Mucilaginibacter yixingensis TaxID=1295612 RepID=A0A2T5J6I2_9SPHI|nr:outer membrane protein assembly factor BamA [Mucilaginibacter yixingensis]
MFLATGCSLTRKLKEHQALVRKITVKGVDKEFAEAAPTFVDKQEQPNNWINLNLYYMFSHDGKKDVGEPPAILDTQLVEYSRQQIERFLQNKGYLKAKVTDSIAVKKKKAHLYFTAVEGPMFRIRRITDSILDPSVRGLYRNNRNNFSHIQPGGRYDTDSLAYDRDEFFQVMKRNGYYDFYRQYINYSVDTAFDNSVADVRMIIGNPEGKKKHPIYTINNTLVTISASNGRTDGKADTLQVDSQFRFVDYSHSFKPKVVTNYVFQKKGDIYNIDKQTLTTSRLSELNVFRNVPNPNYEKKGDSTNKLNMQIDITPLKKMSDRVEGEFIFNNGRYGYNVGNTFTNRNLFKSAAILQVKLNWSVLFDNGNNNINDNGVENQEFKTGVSLTYPRLITPFSVPTLGEYGVPHTTFSSNYSLFYQKGLVTRKSFVNSLTYDFAETAHKLHTFTPIDIEFSSGVIDPAARDSLEKNGRDAYLRLIGRTIFTVGSQYTYQVNADMLNSYGSFTYFKGSVDVGGNTMSLVTNALNTSRDSIGARTLLGHAFSQYVRGEADLRIYRGFGNEKQFVFRINPGIGIPYGNSSQMVFEKEFYAGGANDMRAWLPRTLGPGQFNRASYGVGLVGDDLRQRLKYLDQFGEIKIIGNAEYRYKIADNFFGSKLKGAFFTDFGNIWRLKETSDNPRGEFKLNNLWQSTAIGIGTGLRFDLTYFVFRLDAAFKFKDPQFDGADQWVLIQHFNELFHNHDFKNNYYQTNGESYNFMQLNFGIGLPF